MELVVDVRVVVVAAELDSLVADVVVVGATLVGVGSVFVVDSDSGIRLPPAINNTSAVNQTMGHLRFTGVNCGASPMLLSTNASRSGSRSLRSCA